METQWRIPIPESDHQLLNVVSNNLEGDRKHKSQTSESNQRHCEQGNLCQQKNRIKAPQQKNAAATTEIGTEPLGSVREPPTEAINIGTSMESGTGNRNVELSRIDGIGLDCGTKYVAGTTNWSNQYPNQIGIWNRKPKIYQSDVQDCQS